MNLYSSRKVRGHTHPSVQVTHPPWDPPPPPRLKMSGLAQIFIHDYYPTDRLYLPLNICT